MKFFFTVREKIKPLLSNELKHELKKYIISFNSIFSFARKRPEFIVGGIQKGGTTSIYNYLIEHPDIQPILQKEIHYFDFQYEKGEKWYLGNFPIKFFHNSNSIVGEATPTYLYSSKAPQRIFDFNPNMKMIFLLRNPILRCYSDFKYGVKLGTRNAEADFGARVLEELAWIEKNIYKLETQENTSELVSKHCHYMAPGLYNIWLKKWLQVFPSENIKIIISEEFFLNPQNFTNQIFDFIGLPNYELKKTTPFNTNKYPPIDKKTLEILKNFYKPHVQELQSISQIKVESWEI